MSSTENSKNNTKITVSNEIKLLDIILPTCEIKEIKNILKRKREHENYEELINKK